MALAIVGVGVVTVLEIFSGGMRLEGRILAITEATARSRQVMDEVMIQPKFSERREEGSMGPSHPWRLEVRPLAPESLLPQLKDWGLKEVALEMRYTEGGREKRVELRTLRLVKEKNP